MGITLVKSTLREIRRKVPGIHRVTSAEVVIGVGYTAVRTSTGDVGLANTPLDDLSPESCNVFSRAGTLTDVPTIELAGIADSWDLSERVVGLAALNALSQLAIRKNLTSVVREYGDAVDLTNVRKDDVVVLVGNMRPSAEKLRRTAKEVLVLERSMGLRDKDTLPDTAADAVIPRADVVFMTGATLCNGTADHILELSKNAREVVMLGATAGIFPPSLFRKGATAVGCMEILDARGAMRVAAEGGGTFALLKSAKFVVYKPPRGHGARPGSPLHS
jgi:uncharacterized protein (DUF4213/DUF364 family)